MSPLISFQRCKERGEASIVVTAILLILLVAAAAIFNRLYSFQKMSRLQNMANSLARYGGTFLPNPKLAMDKTQEYWQFLKFSNQSNAELKYFFDSALGEKREVAPAHLLTYGEDIALPVKSFSVHLKESHPFFFMNVWGLPAFSVSAEATVHILPTDVAIVVENSNSLVSKLDAEINATSPDDGVFNTIENWGSLYLPFEPCQKCPSICPPVCATKARRYVRQCFGRMARDVKIAAITLYDLLSSSGTFRVSVIFNSSSSAEQAQVAIPLGTHPYLRNESEGDFSNSTNKNYDPKLFLSTDSNRLETGVYHTFEEVAGDADFSHSRCARLTSSINYMVPLHPLSNIFIDGTDPFGADLTIRPGTSNPTMPSLSPTGPNSSQLLRFYGLTSSSAARYPDIPLGSTFRLLPREAMWIKSFGYSVNGIPEPIHTYNPLQLGILKAIDVLHNAPARSDGLKVKRKVVLVLTDGFEDGKVMDYSEFQSKGVTISDINPHLTDESPELHKSFWSAVTQNSQSPCQNPLFIDNPLGDPAFSALNAHRQTPFNISDSTSVPAVSRGVPVLDDIKDGLKLGILRYGFSSNVDWYGDASLEDLSGANKAVANLVRESCSSSWSTARGRFFVEVDPSHPTKGITSLDSSSSYGYWSTVAPLVARSLFVPEFE